MIFCRFVEARRIGHLRKEQWPNPGNSKAFDQNRVEWFLQDSFLLTRGICLHPLAQVLIVYLLSRDCRPVIPSGMVQDAC